MAVERPELTHADLEAGLDAIALVLAEVIGELPPSLRDQIEKALARHAKAAEQNRRGDMHRLFLRNIRLNSVVFQRFLQHRQNLLDDEA